MQPKYKVGDHVKMTKEVADYFVLTEFFETGKPHCFRGVIAGGIIIERENHLNGKLIFKYLVQWIDDEGNTNTNLSFKAPVALNLPVGRWPESSLESANSAIEINFVILVVV